MPVSESWWPKNTASHDMKRKAPLEEMQQWCPMQNQNAKRQCIWPTESTPLQPQLTAFPVQVEEAMEDANCNNNCSTMQDLNSSSTPSQPSSMWPGNSCGLPTTESQNRSAMQEGQLMDLCGETYNPQATVLAELQDAYIAMDSDCVPNPGQYHSQPVIQQQTPPQQQQQTLSSRSDVCPQYCCGVGESPTSQVRCFCKPNWDGTMSPRRYVSDIY